MYNFPMRIRLTKWGNSLGIRLPKIFAMNMGMHAGDEIRVDIQDQSIVLSKEETLDDLLARIDTNNIHPETNTGAVRGKEVW
ncbi:MAG: antitoxin [Candidatus Peregrinibacteria bacterium Greene0416_62]|nr:MAG: antitoxin [Candidatus Peregrinibacteria bacterium Greene0416_62]TSD00678.1 MAG: antitoxin [Candidatus Peregrinibacteria bacterium Greene1014_49]